MSGDMDNYYLNLAVYLLEDFLKTTDSGATFEYGRPKQGHGWQPMSNAELVKMMAAQIQKNAGGEVGRQRPLPHGAPAGPGSVS